MTNRIPHLSITNEAFIDAIHGGRIPEGYAVAVISKVGNPNEGGWPAEKADEAINKISPDANNYVSNAVFNTDGVGGRFVARKELAAHVNAILIDDVGSKITMDEFRNLKLSWLLETSANNYQAGIILQDSASIELAGQLTRGLINAGLTDPGARGAIRNIRLPVGINGKPEHLSGESEPFRVALRQWCPDARYTPEEIVESLGLTLEEECAFGPPINGFPPSDIYARAALRSELAIIADTPPGVRNRQLNTSAFVLGQLVGAGSLDHSDAEQALLHAAQASGLPRSEASTTIRSGLDAGLKKPRLVTERGSARRSRESYKIDDDDRDPLPLYPELPPSAPYPDIALGPLAPAARAIANKVQVPLAVAGQSVLAVAALAVQAFADVVMPYGQRRPLSLYFVSVLGSGDRKSTADNEASWAIQKHESNLCDRYVDDIAAWTVESAAYVAERRKIEGDKGINLNERREALKALGPEPAKPLAPFITTGDLTVEGLAKAWSAAHPALGVFTAEGGTFIGGHGMSAESQLRTSAALSEAWDGKPIKRIRAQDGVTVLPGRRLSTHLMIQPEASHGFLGDATLRDQGLLSRFLVAAPASLAGGRFYKEATQADQRAIAAFGGRILSILETRPPSDGDRSGGVTPRSLPMSNEARKLWIAFHDHVEAQLGQNGDLAPLKDFASKTAENGARIAGILTIFDDLSAPEISREAMEGAIQLMDWYLAEAERLHSASRLDPQLRRASSLRDWLVAREGASASFREILRFGPSALRTKAAAEDAIRALIDHRQIVQTEERPRVFRLNRGEC